MSEQLHEEYERPTEAWMISFADLLSILLTFFILLYSMSDFSAHQWSSITQAIPKLEQPDAKAPLYPQLIKETVTSQVLDPSYLYHVLKNKLNAHPELKDVHLSFRDDQLVISIENDVLFEKDSAQISLKAISLIFFLGDVLFQIGNKIDVESVASPSLFHNTTNFPSYWDLALTRAMVIAEELQKSGYVYHIDILALSQNSAEKTGTTTPGELSHAIHIIIHHHSANSLL